MPKASVIIPTFNRERFVGEAVRSVLAQSARDCEIIVVDDGSTDNTRRALEPYADQIRYIYQKNGGVSAARNAGIRQATGEWIAFLDSDDEWRPDYLATQLAQARRFPEAVVHITNAVTVFGDGSRSEHFEEIHVERLFRKAQCLLLEKPFRVVLDHSHWFLQSSIMRRQVLLEAGLFDPALTIAEDLDVIARMALKGPFTLQQTVLVEIHRRTETTESLSSQRIKKGLYTRQAFGKVYANLATQSGLSLMEKRSAARALSSNLRALGNILLRMKKRSEAREIYKKALFAFLSFRSFVKYSATFLPQKMSACFVRRGKEVLPGDSPQNPA